MATKSTATPKRTRRTKAEIQEEFEAMQQEATSTVATNSKQNELMKLHEQEIKEAVNEVGVDSIAQKLAHLNLEISRSLSDVSEKMIAEVSMLSKLREAIRIEQQELERLHKIDVSLLALDQLMEDYQAKQETMEEETALTRSQWEEEQERKTREIKEAEDSLKKNRQREMEEYEYKKNLERKKEQDKYEEERRQLDKKNREQQEALEKSWKERETALKSQEEELAQLRKEVADYPNRLKRELDKAVNEAIQQTEQRLMQEKILLERDGELERKISDLKVKTLEGTIAQQQTQIQILQARLEEATKQVQDIAVKAIEGASGTKTLNHVNQIAMEQAKNRASSI
jgi:hypothetical protein